jgi:hypothetical protein
MKLYSQLPVTLGQYGWTNLFMDPDSDSISPIWVRLYRPRSKFFVIPENSEAGESDANQRNGRSSIAYRAGRR